MQTGAQHVTETTPFWGNKIVRDKCTKYLLYGFLTFVLFKAHRLFWRPTWGQIGRCQCKVVFWMTRELLYNKQLTVINKPLFHFKLFLSRNYTTIGLEQKAFVESWQVIPPSIPRDLEAGYTTLRTMDDHCAVLEELR